MTVASDLWEEVCQDCVEMDALEAQTLGELTLSALRNSLLSQIVCVCVMQVAKPLARIRSTFTCALAVTLWHKVLDLSQPVLDNKQSLVDPGLIQLPVQRAG